MGALRISMLNNDEIEKIHKMSCKILADVGIGIGSQDIVDLLLKKGAKIGNSSDRVCFSEKMIRDALATCPRSFQIYSVNGQCEHVGTNRQYSTCLIDPGMNTSSGNNREPELDDCAKNAKIIDSIEMITMPYKMDVKYHGIQSELCVVKSNEKMYENLTKHVICGPFNETEARIWMEMCEIMAPSSNLRKNPIVSALISPSSPLAIHSDCLQMLKCVLEYGIPVICLPCPMCGLTSPLSMSGTLITINAENLALIIITQMLRPGNPMIYHTVAMPADIKTLAARLSAPEKMIMSLAASQMGRYYGIPSAVTGSSTDVSVFDVQNGAETMSHIFPATLSDADLITGIGSNSNACGTSAEQILIDAELLRLAEHFRKGISLDNMHNMFDTITRVQPGGSYASDDSTLEQFKSTNEFFIPELINWSGHSRCEAGLYGKAKLKAEFILENHIPAVPADRLEQLHKYVRNKEKVIMK